VPERLTFATSALCWVVRYLAQRFAVSTSKYKIRIG
jgi:hypothetical protein